MLDSEETLDRILESIELARKYGFQVSTGSSPIVFLLEAAIDIFLHLSFSYEEEIFDQSPEVGINPSIEFDERRTDALGNILSVKKYFRNKAFQKPEWDPEAKEIFQSLAASLVSFKRTNNLRFSLNENLKNVIHLPPNTSEIQKQGSKSKEYRNKKTKSNYYYYRRQRK
jgi:hypothetical protein